VGSPETKPAGSELVAELDRLAAEFAAEIGGLATEQEIRLAQARYLGKKGKLAEPMKALGRLPPEARPLVGEAANRAKNAIEGAVAARLLAEHVPPAALVARYGGDEFVVILPGADVARAQQTADTLRRASGGAIFFDLQPTELRRTPLPQPPPRITASIGVSSYRDHLGPGGSQRHRESTFLRLADSAMYAAKAAGRNRVEIADPED